MEERKKRFYIEGDSSRVDSFVQIPKTLFTDERYASLPIRCKIAYSIYLSRYVATTYHDDLGPYIIFSDSDMASLIDTTPAYVKTVRRRLRDAGLIGYRRSISYNRIYLYSYTRRQDEDNMFFYENTLDSWRFYRFPRRLLEPEFINLPLEAKFIYSMYFDMMCLSQANFFSDSKQRIYFQQSADDQVIRSGFSKPTLKKCRDILKVCHLLNEYHPFSQPIRFYLLKLEQFEDNVFMFENMTAAEKASFIRENDKVFAQQFSSVRKIHDYRPEMKEKGITVAQAAKRFMQDTGKSLSVGGLRKYLNGTRQMPDDVKDSLERLLKGDPPLCRKSDEHSQGKETSILQEKRHAVSRKDSGISPESMPGIRYTDKNNTEERNTEENKTDNNLKKNKKEGLPSLMSSFLSETEFPFSDRDQMFLASVEDYAEKNGSEVFSDTISETHVIAVLNAMASVSFSSPQSQIRYFIKAYEDRKENEYSWFGISEATEKERYLSRCYPERKQEFSDEVKNYKWW